MIPTEALRADLEFVSGELHTLNDEMGDDPTDEQAKRFAEGVEFVRSTEATLDARAERAEAVNASRAAVERAAQFPGAIVPSIPENVNVNRAADPFDLSNITPLTPGSAKRAQALTAVEQMSGPDAARSAAVDTLERFDDRSGTIAERYLFTGSDVYRSAFGKYVTGQESSQTPEERQVFDLARRTAGLTDASGGYAIPFLLDPSVILTNDGTKNPYRMISRIVRGTSDKWNGVSSAGITASWDAEGVEVSDDSATLAQPSIEAHKASQFIPFSSEIQQDWQQMETEFSRLMIDAKDRLEGAAFATGSGSGQPTGIVTALVAGSATTASSTSNAFVLADVYAVTEAIGSRYEDSCSWVMPKAILNDIRQFGTANNYNGFTVDLTATGVSSILGSPVYRSSDLDSTYGSGENYVLVYGDFSNYVIFDRVGMSVSYIPHLFHTANNRPSGESGVYASWRVGADSVNDDAFTVLNIT